MALFSLIWALLNLLVGIAQIANFAFITHSPWAATAAVLHLGAFYLILKWMPEI